MNLFSHLLKFVVFVSAIALVTGCGSNSNSNDPVTVDDSTDSGSESCAGCILPSNQECAPGTSDDACGSGGERCSQCAQGETCNSMGECTEMQSGECTPSTCDGCCDSGECKPGTESIACGSGGEECTTCSDVEKCDASGECVEQSCSSENCDGCCENGECKEGNTQSQCGSGGQDCTACGTEARCIDQKCEACSGCWSTDDQCQSGTTADACGTAGSNCVECDSEQTCENGNCVDQVDQNCSENCDGCCTGSNCISTSERTADACGSGGEACVPCAEGSICNQSGECELDPESKWDVVVVESKIDSSENYDPYNWSGSEPDPYAVVTVADATGNTSAKQNTYEPTWYETPITAATAKQIIDTMTYELMDADRASDDDVIVTDCTPDFTAEDIQSQTGRHTCQDSDGRGHTTKFRFEFSGGSN